VLVGVAGGVVGGVCLEGSTLGVVVWGRGGGVVGGRFAACRCIDAAVVSVLLAWLRLQGEVVCVLLVAVRRRLGGRRVWGVNICGG